MGVFTVPNLVPGTYSVRIEKEGFRPSTTTGIAINAGATARIDAVLEVGASAQAIEVSASAVQLQTENAKSTTVITDKLIRTSHRRQRNLRSPFDLAILTPEAKNFGDNNFQIGGGQAASFGVQLDGISANTTRALSNSWVATNTPSLEALTEFTVETNGFKAEFGAAGGGAINFISKSGTNNYHGVALRVPSQRCDGRARLLPGEKGRIQTERLRRHGRWAGVDSQDLQRQEQDLLLHLLRGVPKSQGRGVRHAPCQLPRCTTATSATGLTLREK